MASSDISVSLKTNNIKDKDDDLVLNFEGGSVVSKGGNIKITQDGKTIEEIAIGGGKTSGGVYHSNSIVWDYEYNWIGLVNDDIFMHLANHNNKKISDKTGEEWTTELRNDWKIAINGDLYSLAKRDQTLSSDDSYNYHETYPEYTPGVDKSGNRDVVLTPSSGIEQLIIDPSNLENGGSYLIDLSDAGLISASGNSQDLLPPPLEISVGTLLTPTPSPSPEVIKSKKSKKLLGGQFNLKLTGKKNIKGIGNNLDNQITGNKGKNLLKGLSGDDILIGGSGKDNLQGGVGNDILKGGSGKDKLKGGSGADTFMASKGTDTIYGFNIQQGDLLSGFGDTSGLDISDSGKFCIVSGNGYTARLKGVDAADLIVATESVFV